MADMNAEFTNSTTRSRQTGEGSVGSGSLRDSTKTQNNSVKFGVPSESHERYQDQNHNSR